MAVYAIYVLQTNDFITGLPDEAGNGNAAGSPPYTLTVSPTANWVEILVEDDDSDFGEESAGSTWAVSDGGDVNGPTQALAAPVTLNGVTYNIGDTIVSAYDLVNSTTGMQVTSLHIGAGIDGYQTGPVLGVVSNQPMPPGTYTFDQAFTSAGRLNPYSGLLCFASGTMIQTEFGERAIEDIDVGDNIVVVDNKLRAVRWIRSTTVAAIDNFAPVVITKGALGNERDLVVSPQHRMLLSGWKAELLFGEPQVLCAAIHLVNGDTIYRREGGEVEYFHMMFDSHEIVFSEGCPSESFFPGEAGMGVLDEATREEIFTLFPELRKDLSNYGPTRCMTLKSHEARVFAS